MPADIILKQGEIINFGLELIRAITPRSSELSILKYAIEKYQPAENYQDDVYIWLTVILALQAADRGNFGVGSLLVNENGDVAAAGHNKVFEPYFRGDLHAEMVVMNEFENNNREINNLGAYTLYTSLESCPMCLMRLITSGVGTVLHASCDIGGGMVNKMEYLPPAWKILSQRQTFKQAQCSETMINTADSIFTCSADQLYIKLENRRVV